MFFQDFEGFGRLPTRWTPFVAAGRIARIHVILTLEPTKLIRVWVHGLFSGVTPTAGAVHFISCNILMDNGQRGLLTEGDR